MKEEIENIITTSHTDMGYKFLCITENDVPVTITRLHRLFLQKQIEMLENILSRKKNYYIVTDNIEAVEIRHMKALMINLQNQLDNE